MKGFIDDGGYKNGKGIILFHHHVVIIEEKSKNFIWKKEMMIFKRERSLCKFLSSHKHHEQNSKEVAQQEKYTNVYWQDSLSISTPLLPFKMILF